MAADEKGNELASAVATLTTLVQNLTTRVEALAKESAPAEVAGLKKTVGDLAAQFEKMQGVTKAAIDERERERQYLVHELAGNHRVPFSAAELETKPIEELRKLSTMVSVENFAGKGGPGGQREEARFAEPRPYWEQDKKEGK